MNRDDRDQADSRTVGCVFGWLYIVLGAMIALGGSIYVGVPSLFLWEQNPWLILWIAVPLGISLMLFLLAFCMLK